MNARRIALLGALAVSMFDADPEAWASPGRQPIKRQMTCAEFLRSDDGVKPEIVYWFATRPTLGASDSVIDVESTDRLVPVLVDRCAEAPESLVARQVAEETTSLRRRQESP
jgi:hypothetical protein